MQRLRWRQRPGRYARYRDRDNSRGNIFDERIRWSIPSSLDGALEGQRSPTGPCNILDIRHLISALSGQSHTPLPT